MADFIGGHGQPGIDRSEHIGASQGENIEAKRVAGYVWNGTGWERSTGGKPVLRTKVDTASSTVTYVGKAAPGSATSSAVWQIKKIDTSSGVDIKWAASGLFTQVWDNRAGLTYS